MGSFPALLNQNFVLSSSVVLLQPFQVILMQNQVSGPCLSHCSFPKTDAVRVDKKRAAIHPSVLCVKMRTRFVNTGSQVTPVAVTWIYWLNWFDDAFPRGPQSNLPGFGGVSVWVCKPLSEPSLSPHILPFPVEL